VGNLFILRHGNTFDAGDIVRRVGARTDLPLSVSGRQQAQMVAKHYAEKGISFERIVASPLLRTRQTAEAVKYAIAGCGDIEFLPFLREIDYGPDENQPEEVVIARVGMDALSLWETNYVLPQGWQADVVAIKVGWLRLIEQARQLKGDTLAVTSNGIARFVLPLLNEVSTAGVSLKLGTCCQGIVACELHPARLLIWNERLV
jgi:broad specificity phosphatase PhoE